MKKFSSFVACLGLTFSLSSQAALMEVTLTGQVVANQTHSTCPTVGFNVCNYFPINDTVSMSLIYDDQTPLSYVLNGTNGYHDNAFQSISFNSNAVSYSGSFASSAGFGHFNVRNGVSDGLTFGVWEPTQGLFAYDTANPMDLTTLFTSVANPADDAYGDIEIDAIRVNLTANNGVLFNSTSIPASFSLGDFDLLSPSTNWLFTVRSHNLGGWRGSVGLSITGLSQRAVNTGTETTDPSGNGTVPVPMTLALVLSGLALIARQRRPR